MIRGMDLKNAIVSDFRKMVSEWLDPYFICVQKMINHRIVKYGCVWILIEVYFENSHQLRKGVKYGFYLDYSKVLTIICQQSSHRF